MFQMKKKMKKIKINEIFTTDDVLTATNLIFNQLVLKEDLNDFINSNNVDTLNQDYYLSHSGDKYISPFVERLFNAGKTASEISSYVATICYNRFGEKWKKIYDALITEYNPLENYSMEETRTPNLTDSDTENVGTSISSNRTTNTNSKYKGFNADAPVTITTTDGNENSSTTGTKLANETTRTSTHTGTEKLTRAGNIGVTTSQMMLNSEFKVRQYDFYKELFNDIDSVMALMIY